MDTAEDRAQSMPPQVYASRMQETPVPAAPSTLPRPLMPRVQLPNSQFSGSHLSQLSGPLFTEDRYSTSSGGDQEACDAVGGPFTSTVCTVLLSKLCLDPHVPSNELHDALGNVVRWCASSLLGSYVHQELI